jgi:hypothetical protein
MSSSQDVAERTTESTESETETETTRQSGRRKLFGDCALVEIIHLHDCLRGALKALENDVNVLSQTFLEGGRNSELSKLERRVAGRFQVIWSVFRAHSSAEDEFIWPTLQSKTQGMVKGSPPSSPHHKSKPEPTSLSSTTATTLPLRTTTATAKTTTTTTPPPSARADDSEPADQEINIEQEEYEEDHADEERMFSRMDNLLTKLRSSLLQQRQTGDSIDDTMHAIHSLSKTLSVHLMAHLEKEEQQCLPLVVKHLSKSEIHDLVGRIMGKRSSDMIAQIMTMAVQNLEQKDRQEMIEYMKQAMAGTFFDRWLSMSGWADDSPVSTGLKMSTLEISAVQDKEDSSKRTSPATPSSSTAYATESQRKKAKTDDDTAVATSSSSDGGLTSRTFHPAREVTSQAELEKLIRAIAANPNLSSLQKNTTIQGLRDSVWKSNQLLRRASETQSADGNNDTSNNNGDSMRAAQGHTSTSRYVSILVACYRVFRLKPHFS